MYKKLNTKYTKYIIVKVIGSYTYYLDTPSEIHSVQPIRRLYLTVTNPLSEQQLTNVQPLEVAATVKGEYKVERILNEKAKRGKGKQYLIKWKGYKRPIWEPRRTLKDTVALNV